MRQKRITAGSQYLSRSGVSAARKPKIRWSLGRATKTSPTKPSVATFCMMQSQ